MALTRSTLTGRTTGPSRISTTDALRRAWTQEPAEARAARRRWDPAAEWAGNTGGADVSPLRPLSIPDDLRALLEGPVGVGALR